MQDDLAIGIDARWGRTGAGVAGKRVDLGQQGRLDAIGNVDLVIACRTRSHEGEELTIDCDGFADLEPARKRIGHRWARGDGAYQRGRIIESRGGLTAAAWGHAGDTQYVGCRASSRAAGDIKGVLSGTGGAAGCEHDRAVIESSGRGTRGSGGRWGVVRRVLNGLQNVAECRCRSASKADGGVGTTEHGRGRGGAKGNRVAVNHQRLAGKGAQR